MKILVANIGSTSFKFRLLDMTDERELARGGVERIGSDRSRVFASAAGKATQEREAAIGDHGEAVEANLQMLLNPEHGCLGSLEELTAIGFKAVHGGSISEPVRVTDEVLGIMEDVTDLAPAHNPPYLAAMRAFGQRLPKTPQVAAFETGFHQTIPQSRRTYGIPYAWTSELGVRRYGFHGASHEYIAVRTGELFDQPGLRLISCHLGGSSSICAIEGGKSVANSFGTTAQSGLPHNNRVGDFDAFALNLLLRRTGLDLDSIFAKLSTEGGLLGISGVSNDMRDLEEAAASGNERAKLAIEVLVESVRHYIGAYLAAMNGADVVVFTGGIGENGCELRRQVCGGFDYAGVKLDEKRNSVRGKEATISADDSKVKVMTIPTNEELIVARHTKQVLERT
jgi:acetate kinase